jgi:hypothetical protein
MRLKILNNGYKFGTKVLFAFIQLVSRRPVPDGAHPPRDARTFRVVGWRP